MESEPISEEQHLREVTSVPAVTLMKTHLEGRLRIHIETILMLTAWLALYHAFRWLLDALLRASTHYDFQSLTQILQTRHTLFLMVCAVIAPVIATTIIRRMERLFAADIFSDLIMYTGALIMPILLLE